MATSNHERVGKGLDQFRAGLAPFVERELKAKFGKSWAHDALEVLRAKMAWQGRDGEPTMDTQALLVLMWEFWNEVFRNTLGPAERSLVSELRDVRNKWAHQSPFTNDDTYRALDSMQRLLSAVSAADPAREVDRMKQEVLRIRYEEQAKKETRKVSVAPTEGQPQGGLKPWREVVTPHPDVASGKYMQAEFAADLAQVHRDEGSSEYRDPKEFFRRTYITEGLRHLLKNALLRLSGHGGDPVVELQTNFGGGKTHSMLALYHLFSGVSAGELTGVDAVLADTGGNAKPIATKRAVLVGTALSPGQPHAKPDGTVTRTLWGELAWQLGGKEGHGMLAQADATGTNPGSQLLKELFNRYAPCLILIDEWVAYARQLYGVEGLPAGSFDAHFSFSQSLSEAAKAAKQTLLIVSIPASDIEVGGEGGKAALDRLKNSIGRVESTWRPASAEEGFEIVRRRLFQPIVDPHLFAARDAVATAFSRLYLEQQQEFPSETREVDYERRIKAAYPIHPELFDRLYNDWGSLDKFQRTRGVLRLMAAVIHELWERQDGSLLILPATMPIDAPAVQFELTRYLEDPWTPILERDVDGTHSLPLKVDRETPNLGRYSACRRVARAIYIGSAPTAKTAHPGLDERRIKLGCVQPGESVATFGDALRRLTDQATHLYVDGKRYWYSLQPSVTRLAQDRAAQLDIHDVWEELKKRLRVERDRGDFTKVHVAPDSSGDVPDEMETRLVILGPDFPHASKQADSPAMREAAGILNKRGGGDRHYKNMLVFLAPDRQRLDDLHAALRQYLAWNSVMRDKENLNLDTFQTNQAETKRDTAETAVASRIKETFAWLLVPTQPDPQGPVQWQESRLQGTDSLAARASKKLRNDGLMVVQFSPVALRLELDKYLWKDADHLLLKRLWEYLAKYSYLTRFRDSNVLLEAVHAGISQVTWHETFAYAQAWDEANGRYLGLKAGQLTSVTLDEHSVILKPDVARRQMDADAQQPRPGSGGNTAASGTEAGTPGTSYLPEPTPPSGPQPPKRFHGTVTLDTTRVGRDASRIADEVLSHLAGLMGADVTVTMDISARVPGGLPENVVRTVSENCRTLKFDSQGFEEE